MKGYVIRALGRLHPSTYAERRALAIMRAFFLSPTIYGAADFEVVTLEWEH
jgi:hypothetical protein